MAAIWEIIRTVELQADAPGVERLQALASTSSRAAHRLRIRPTQGGKPADLAGCKASLSLILPDSASLYVEDGEIADGEARCDLPQIAYNRSGEVHGVLHLIRDGAALPLFAFVLVVRADLTDTIEDPNHVIPSIAELLAEVEAMRKATQAANTAADTAQRGEQQRDTAEQARQTAEQARVTAEQGRDDAEAKRVLAEADRASAEGLRESAEQARETAEQARDEAEQGRAAAEQARQTAEQARADAEDARDDAEAARAAAEALRESAEQQRVTESAGALRDALAAVQAAEGWANAEASSEDVGPDTPARVEATTDENGNKIITFYLRQGATGKTGEQGPPGNIEDLTINGKKTVEGKIDLTAEDVQALPASAIRPAHALIPTSAWAGDAASGYTATAAHASLTVNTRWIDMQVSPETAGNYTADLAITFAAGAMTVTTAEKPTGELDLTMILCEVAAETTELEATQ